MILYSIDNAIYLDVCRLNKGDNDKYFVSYDLYDEELERNSDLQIVSCVQISGDEETFSSGTPIFGPDKYGALIRENSWKYGNSIVASDSGNALFFTFPHTSDDGYCIILSESSLNTSSGEYIRFYNKNYSWPGADSANVDSGNIIHSYFDNYYDDVLLNKINFDENAMSLSSVSSSLSTISEPAIFNQISKLNNDRILLFSEPYLGISQGFNKIKSCLFSTSGDEYGLEDICTLDKYPAQPTYGLDSFSCYPVHDSGSISFFSREYAGNSNLYIGYVGVSGTNEIYHHSPVIIDSGELLTNTDIIKYDEDKFFGVCSYLDGADYYGRYYDLTISGEEISLTDSGVFDGGVLYPKLSLSPSGDVIIFYGKSTSYVPPEEIVYKNYAAYKDITIHYEGGSAGEDEETEYLTDLHPDTYFSWEHYEATSYVDYLQLSLNQERTIYYYTIQDLDEGGFGFYETPSAWTLKGSNNESDWYILDSRTGQTFDEGEEKSYNIANPSGFQYYRLYPSGEDGYSYSFSEWAMYAIKEKNSMLFDYVDLDDSIIAAWPFEESSGNPTDIINSGIQIESTAIEHNTYQNNGVNNYCLYSHASYNIMSSKRPAHYTFTYSIWVNLYEYGPIIWFYGNIFIAITSSGYFYISGDLGNDTSSIEFSENTWYFLTITRDGDTGEFNLYVNGIYACGGNLTTAGYIDINTSRGGLNFWRVNGSNFQGAYGGGYLDEYYWFDRVLTTNEILWLYNNGDGNYLHEPIKNEGPSNFIYGTDTDYRQKKNTATDGGITKLRAYNMVGGQYDAINSKIYGDLIWNGSNDKFIFYADEERKYQIAEYVAASSTGIDIEISGSGIGDGMNIVFDYDLS